MQAELSPQSGQLVGGKYRMIRALGHGAMGVVYEAQHMATGKRVAIKWLHPHVMESRSAVERLVREAQASARVRHTNVVDVYDVEREGDTLFLVMEYLEGEPLSSLLERGGVPRHEVIALIVQAMRGVAEAHRQGIVHRDIKPDNIFLAYESDQPLPVPKVLDFGISKLDVPSGGLSLTQTGSTLGTPLYMSFEQLSGQRDVDARSDIYAFGVILYEALTGTMPYVAENFAELAAKVVTTDPVPPHHIRPDISEALEQVVLWAMRKRREERPANLGMLIDALMPFTRPDAPAASAPLHATSMVPPRSVPSLASAPVAASGPALRLDPYAGWNDVLDRDQRSRREMEDRVTALVAGTMSSEFPRKKPSSRGGAWLGLGVLVVLAGGGLAVASTLRNDLAHGPDSVPPESEAAERAPEPAKVAEPSTAAQPAAVQNEPAAPAEAPPAVAEPDPAPEQKPIEPLDAAPTQVEQVEIPPAAPAHQPPAAGQHPARPAGGKGAAKGAAASKPPARGTVWQPSGESTSDGVYVPPSAPAPEAEAPPPPREVAPAQPEPSNLPSVDEFVPAEGRPSPSPGGDDYRAGRPSEEEF